MGVAHARTEQNALYPVTSTPTASVSRAKPSRSQGQQFPFDARDQAGSFEASAV